MWLLSQQAAAEEFFEISWFELAAAFYCCGFCHPHLSTHANQWIEVLEGRFSESSLTVALRIRYARSLVRFLARHFSLSVVFVSGIDLRRLNVNYPLSGLVLGLTDSTLRQVDQLLLAFTARRTVRTATDLARPFVR